jgi:hypothetical protein
MLETVRQFVAERLAARPDAAALARRHADHYRALAERADRRLRGVGMASGSIACRPRPATWPQPCAGTWRTTPRRSLTFFRLLWPCWFLGDHIAETRA